MAKKQVKVSCQAAGTLPYTQISAFQGELKSLSKENFQRLRGLILRNGVTQPISVWKQGDIYWNLDGHQRCRVFGELEKEGYEIPPIPVNFVEAGSIKQAKEILLSNVAQFGKVEKQGLYEYLHESGFGFDFYATNFEIPGLDTRLFEHEFYSDAEAKAAESEKENEIPSVPKKAKTKLGDVYVLGNHRLLCGDCTKDQDFKRLMDGKTAEICFTSPPYADQREYNGGKELSTEHLATFISVAKDSGLICVNLGLSRKNHEISEYWDDYIEAARKAGLKLMSWNIWDRGQAVTVGQQTAMFPVEHEWIFVFGEKRKKLTPTVPNKSAGDFSTPKNRNPDGSTFTNVNIIRSFRELGTIVRLPANGGTRGVDHPATFPVALPQAYIEAASAEGGLVYEPFGGSGTTLIAAEKTGRRCNIMELDPHYCDVIVARWEQFTGQKASLAGGRPSAKRRR